TEPLPTRDELRQRVGAQHWAALFERPLGETIEEYFADDLIRGVVFTDALIGTFTHAHDPSLVQNRCFLYHVIGGGTGDWDVPVGGMGAVSEALAHAAGSAGATLVTSAHVTAVDAGPSRATVHWDDDAGAARAVEAGHVLAGCSPYELAGLLGQDRGERPEGSQLKVNMLLTRLPRL